MKTWIGLACLGGLGVAWGLVACGGDDTAGNGVDAGPDALNDGGGGGGDDAAPVDAGGGEAEAGASTIGPGPYTVLYAGTIVGIDLRPVTTATFDGLKMTGYEASTDEHPELGTNEVKEAQGDALILTGRWAGGTTAGKFYNAGDAGLLDLPANGGFQYVIGIPADPIPSSGAASYATLFQTVATVSDGSLTPGTITGSAAANFAGATSKVGFSLALNIPGDGTYTLETTGGVANVSTSESMVGAGSAKGVFTANVAVGGTGTACGDSGLCTGAVYGVVAGPNAERIGLVAHIYSGAGGAPKTVSGAIVFSKQ